MKNSPKFDELIVYFEKKVKEYEDKISRYKMMVHILSEETNNKIADHESDDSSFLNSREEVRNGILDFFNNHQSRATTTQLERFLKSKDYIGHSKRGLKHSIGTILNKDSSFYRIKNSKDRSLREYAFRSMEKVEEMKNELQEVAPS